MRFRPDEYRHAGGVNMHVMHVVLVVAGQRCDHSSGLLVHRVVG